MFQRRTRLPLGERLRELVWPRRGFARAVRYYGMRILRLRATPHAIATGVAAGVFAGTTPFLGLHIILASAITWALGGNLVASALATFVCNPLTIPFIWGGTYELGRLMLHRTGSLAHHAPGLHPVDIGGMLTHFQFADLARQVVRLWEPVLEPMAVGALPLGLLFAVGAYFLTRWSVSAFQAERRKRLREKAGATERVLAGP